MESREKASFVKPQSPPNDRVMWVLVIAPVVLTFGLVAAAVVFGSSRVDAAMLVAGSPSLPAYLSSQDLHGSTYDTRSDCLALGALDWWSIPALVPGGDLAQEASPSCDQPGWTSRMTVGERIADDGTVVGYDSTVEPLVGEIDDATFSYWRRDHTVDGLYYLDTDERPYELILDVDHGLPTGMLLHLGGVTLLLPYAEYSTEEAAHAWQLESAPQWTDGQGLEVVLSHNPWLKTEPERVW